MRGDAFGLIRRYRLGLGQRHDDLRDMPALGAHAHRAAQRVDLERFVPLRQIEAELLGEVRHRAKGDGELSVELSPLMACDLEELLALAQVEAGVGVALQLSYDAAVLRLDLPLNAGGKPSDVEPLPPQRVDR